MAVSERDFEPIRVDEIELGGPLEGISPRTSPNGSVYRRALAFVRLHTEPVGLVEVDLDDDGATDGSALANAVWSAAGERARRHLVEDGIETPAGCDAVTVAAVDHEEPPCLRERADFLGSAPELTVLVPTRERPERLRRCLDSILASHYPANRISLIVVDNAPTTSDTRSMVDSYGERCDILYLREEATGSASARNRGIREVGTDLVVMTDDDTVVDRHWLTEMARTFTAFPEASAVSGLLLPMELDTLPQVWFEQYGGFSRGFDRRVFDLEANRPANEPLFPWAPGIFGTGNNFAFRTSAIREIGAFDAALGNGTPTLGGVDSEIMLRTILAGHTIVYEPRAVVHHAHRPDYRALRRQIHAYGAGMVACHLKSLIANPDQVVPFVRKLPGGLRFALSPRSGKNSQKRSDYPRELTWLELTGMLYGPIGYLRSRRRYGRHTAPLAPR